MTSRNLQRSMFEDSDVFMPSAGEPFGTSPSTSPGGEMEKSGLEAAPAPASAQQEKAKGLQTLVTSGLIGRDSLRSAALQQSLESRLLRRLDTAGSTLFKLTWRHKTTPLGRLYLERAASVLRTSDKGCTSVPTPNTMDTLPPMDYERRLNHPSRPGRTTSGNLREVVTLGSVPTPMAGSPATETYNAAGNTDYSRRIVELAAVPSPCTPSGGRSTSTEAMDATGRTADGRKHAATLEHAVKFATVATPAARDYKSDSATEEFHERQWDQSRGKPLSAQATLAQCAPGVDPDGSIRGRLDQLPRQAQLAASGTTATGGTEKTASSGQLDPAYSRWLMGVPPEWDGFVCTATRSVSQRRRSSSARTSRPKV